MKLDQEPRLSNGPSLFASLVDWARSVVRSVNSLYNSFLSAIGTPRTGALSITETLDGPAFAAYRSTAQAITAGAFNGAAMNAEELDTANCFNTTTGVFTPNVPGWYFLSGAISMECTSGGWANAQVMIYKNGASKRRGTVSLASNGSIWAGVASGLIFLNGSTDAVQLVAYAGGGTGTTTFQGDAAGAATHFSGYLARRA